MIDWHSFFIYNFALVINVGLAYVSVKFFQKFNFLDLLNACLYTLFFGFRYNVGNDYEGYSGMFHAIRLGKVLDVEPLLYFLTQAFDSSFEGHVYVLATFSFLTFLVLILGLRGLNVLREGIFFFYVSELLFMVNDQVRQGLAIVIFLYAIDFIKRGYFWKYLIIIVVTGLLVHKSALFLVLVYPLRYVKLNRPVIFILTGASYILYLSKKLYFIFFLLMLVTPGYSSFLDRGGKFLEAEQLGSGMAFLFWIFVSLVVLNYSFNNYGKSIYFKILFFALIGYILTIEFHLFNRLLAYLIYVKVVFFSVILSKEKALYPKIVALLLFLFFELEVALNLGKHGGFPYYNFLFPGSL